MIHAVSSNPEIRSIFRREVQELSDQYRAVNRASNLDSIPESIRRTFTREQLAQATSASGFATFKRSWLAHHLTRIQEQAMYKGSISLGASFIRPGEALSTVLARAEAAATIVKNEYKARFGFDTAKYGSGEEGLAAAAATSARPRGAPVAISPVP